MISANQIVGNVGELNNSGVIAGRNLTRIYTNQLENQGTILGETVDLSAQQNLINLGGRIEAVKSLSLSAGKNLDISSTLSSSESADGNVARTVLDRLASVKVTGAGGHLALHSNENLTIKAADIESQGSLSATAGNMLNVTTLTVSNKEYYNGDADNYYRLAQHSEVGSTLKGKDDVSLVVKKDVRIRQSDIGSENGNVLIGSQQGGIQVEVGREEEQLASASKSVSRGRFGLSKTTEIRRHEHDIAQSVSSNIDGKTVNLIAGQGNVTVQGSNVVGENGLTVQAKNIDIKEAENKFYSDDFHSKKKSGMLGGGLGVTFGAQKQTLESDKTKFYAQGSQVGSLNGNVTLIAENHYTQTASLVSAIKGGDVNILAKKVDIKAADDKYETNTKQTFEQKGVTLAITSPVISAIQAVQGVVQSTRQVGESKHGRVNAMAAANAGFDAYRAAQSVGQAANDVGKFMSNTGNVDSVIGAQITYGQQKNESRTHTEGKTAAKSQVNADGKVNIVATGAGKDSNINIEGSDISGKQGTTLMADNQVNIKAAEQNHQERSTNKSSGFNAGVAIKVSNGEAAGVTLGGNSGKGYGNGDETTYVASHVGDSQSKTVINAGGDVTLASSQVKGKRVELNAENLNIESLQDKSRYHGKQMNMQGSVTVGYGFAAGGSFNKSKINADHASVNEQAGIYAGDEGYDINVNKHTDLKGALITSTQKAEADGKNHFSTGSLTHSDIENHSNYSGSSFGVSGSVSANFETPFGENGAAQSTKQATDKDGNLIYRNDRGELTTEAKNAQGKDNAKQLATGWDSLETSTGLGVGRDKESQSSVTKSSINTSNIEIRDQAEQLAKTGETVEQTLDSIRTDVTTDNAEQHSGKLENHFDKDKVMKELNIQVKVTQDFRKNAFSMIDAYVLPKQAELRKQIKEAKTEEEKIALYGEIYKLQYQKRLLETVVGIAAGSPDVAITQGTLQLAATKMREETLANSRLFKGIKDAKTGKILRNDSYDSGYFDGVKLGGVRIDINAICTQGVGSCEKNADGLVVFKGENGFSLDDAIDPKKNEKASGLYGETGGFQSVQGEWNLHFTRIPYSIGSISDMAVESFAGTHDLLGGQVWGWYDKQGNTAEKNKLTGVASGVTTVIAIPVSAPFALSDVISSDMFELLMKIGGK